MGHIGTYQVLLRHSGTSWGLWDILELTRCGYCLDMVELAGDCRIYGTNWHLPEIVETCWNLLDIVEFVGHIGTYQRLLRHDETNWGF